MINIGLPHFIYMYLVCVISFYILCHVFYLRCIFLYVYIYIFFSLHIRCIYIIYFYMLSDINMINIGLPHFIYMYLVWVISFYMLCHVFYLRCICIYILLYIVYIFFYYIYVVYILYIALLYDQCDYISDFQYENISFSFQILQNISDLKICLKDQ